VTITIQTKRATTIIDDEDADLTAFKWFADVRGSRKYIQRNVWENGRNRVSRLHREIAARAHGAIPAGMVVDHINGDTTDNRRCNLRVVPQWVNARNIAHPHARNASGVLGVQRTSSGKWAARIMLPGKVAYTVGRFDTIEEAAAARLAAEREVWGIQPRRAAAHAAAQ
jgi:hypothetical protein